MKGWGERRGAGGNHSRGNGEGGKGRFWGAGDRQSHRGSALSLTGWGSYPRPQRKGTPSDSTICRPSNHPSPHLQAPGSPHPPFSPAHTAAPAPPGSCTLLCTPAHLSPLPGLQFCTNAPSGCLERSALASSACLCFRLTLRFPGTPRRLSPHAPQPPGLRLFPRAPSPPPLLPEARPQNHSLRGSRSPPSWSGSRSAAAAGQELVALRAALAELRCWGVELAEGSRRPRGRLLLPARCYGS